MKKNNAAPIAANARTAAPIPIPAFAPVLRPLDVATAVLVGDGDEVLDWPAAVPVELELPDDGAVELELALVAVVEDDIELEEVEADAGRTTRKLVLDKSSAVATYFEGLVCGLNLKTNFAPRANWSSVMAIFQLNVPETVTFMFSAG
jgi:hypothetical protein